MTRSQKQLAVLFVLIVVMLAVYARGLRSSGLPPRQPTKPPPQVTDMPVQVPDREPATRRPTTALAVPERSSQREVQRQRTTLLAWHRDPFTRGAAIGEMSGLTLSGILWDPSAPIAIINGQMVHVGQDVEGYQVVDISSDRVSLTDGTETFQLNISP